MLEQMLVKTVTKYPNKTAIAYDRFKLSYQELYANIVGFSKGLSQLGIGRSDCVAIVLPNCPEFAISFYAAAKLQAIALPLNPQFKETEIKYYISDSQVRVIITDKARAEICQNIISQVDWPIELVVIDDVDSSSHCFYNLIIPETENDQEIADYEGDVLYQYSSGSTGRPKKLCRTQKNLFHQAHNCTTTLNITSSDNILAIVPMFHAYGFGECLLAATCTGATLVILEQFVQNGISVEMPFVFRALRVLQLIEQQKVTIFPGVPYIFSILAATPQETQTNLSTVRLCISAGNFLSKDIFDKFIQRFGIPLRQLYGCTEAGAVAINLEDESTLQYNSIGQAMKNVEIQIMDDDGNECPSEAIGEMVIKSETLTRGYCQMSELNKEVFKAGHFFTGDLGKKDEKGRIYITGRKKIFIDTGGHKVDPIELEDILIGHPKVKEVVVVGVKGTVAGELIKAAIVVNEQCNAEEIVSYCKNKIADFKIPKIIEFRQELPKNPLGKVLRKKV